MMGVDVQKYFPNGHQFSVFFESSLLSIIRTSLKMYVIGTLTNVKKPYHAVHYVLRYVIAVGIFSFSNHLAINFESNQAQKIIAPWTS